MALYSRTAEFGEEESDGDPTLPTHIIVVIALEVTRHSQDWVRVGVAFSGSVWRHEGVPEELHGCDAPVGVAPQHPPNQLPPFKEVQPLTGAEAHGHGIGLRDAVWVDR